MITLVFATAVWDGANGELSSSITDKKSESITTRPESHLSSPAVATAYHTSILLLTICFTAV